MVSAEAADELEVVRAADTGDLGAEVFGELDGSADPARGAVNSHCSTTQVPAPDEVGRGEGDAPTNRH